MEIVAAVEQRRPVKETPLEKLQREARQFFVAFLRTSVLALILAPFLIFAFLSVDLPYRSLDQFFSAPATKPGNWLSLGLISMSAAPFIAILMARRFGGEATSLAITFAWSILAFAAFAGVSYLSPELEAGDFPRVSFVVAFVLSSIMAQFMAAGAYDILRGGEAWWRAPLFAALGAFITQAVLYFPITYWSSNAPWINWLVQYVALGGAATVVFLGVYRLLMKSLKPRGGFGG